MNVIQKEAVMALQARNEMLDTSGRPGRHLGANRERTVRERSAVLEVLPGSALLHRRATEALLTAFGPWPKDPGATAG